MTNLSNENKKEYVIKKLSKVIKSLEIIDNKKCNVKIVDVRVDDNDILSYDFKLMFEGSESTYTRNLILPKIEYMKTNDVITQTKNGIIIQSLMPIYLSYKDDGLYCTLGSKEINLLYFYFAKLGVTKTKKLLSYDFNPEDQDDSVSTKLKKSIVDGLETMSAIITDTNKDDICFWRSELGKQYTMVNPTDKGEILIRSFEKLFSDYVQDITSCDGDIFESLNYIIQNIDTLTSVSVDQYVKFISDILNLEFAKRITYILNLGSKLTFDKLLGMFKLPTDFILSQTVKRGGYRYDITRHKAMLVNISDNLSIRGSVYYGIGNDNSPYMVSESKAKELINCDETIEIKIGDKLSSRFGGKGEHKDPKITSPCTHFSVRNVQKILSDKAKEMNVSECYAPSDNDITSVDKFEGAFVGNPDDLPTCKMSLQYRKPESEKVEYQKSIKEYAKEIIEEKEYLRHCIEYLNAHDYCIDYDTNSYYPDLFGTENAIIRMYEELIIKQDKEKIIKLRLKDGE